MPHLSYNDNHRAYLEKLTEETLKNHIQYRSYEKDMNGNIVIPGFMSWGWYDWNKDPNKDVYFNQVMGFFIKKIYDIIKELVVGTPCPPQHHFIFY